MPPFKRLSEWQEPEPLPDELVEGILHRAMKLILGGGPKTFKTWNLMDLGISVAIGGEWLGFQCQKGRVLYLNFELGAPFCQRRLKSITNAMGLTFAELDSFEVANLRGHAIEVNAFVNRIEERISDGNYSLVIFDPMYKLLGRLSENLAEDVAKVMNALDRLAVRCNVAVVFGHPVVFGHHFSKGNQSRKEAMDRVSGSGVWARDPDSLIMVTRHEQDQAYTVSSILRNNPPIEDFVIQWEHPRMRRREDLNPAQLSRGSRTATFTPEQVLEVLRSAGTAGMATGEWQTACIQQLKIGASTFNGKMMTLRRDGRVVNTGGRNFVAGLALHPSQEGESGPPPEEESNNSNLDTN